MLRCGGNAVVRVYYHELSASSFSMRHRCRQKFCRSKLLCFWLLLVFFVILTVVFMDPLFGDLTKKDPISHPHQRLASASDLEVLVDSRDQAERYGALSSLSSLKDDQLLIVQATPERNPPQPKKGTYKVLIPGAKKVTAVPVPTHGDWGRPVRLKLQGREKDIEEAGLRKYGFNEVVSERISLRRRLPEIRHPACLTQQYSASLPSASVVICFHNEAWSTLLRTVHSVLDTAPRQHLHEILLVDDLSQHGHLKSVLSEYVSRLDGVRLIRSTKRLGVAGCRMLGAARAQGDVLVFLDSHCECHGGWLEPLLHRIAGDRSRVVSSVLDVIDWQTFQYSAVPQLHRGVFDWRLDFHWEALSEQEDPPTRPIQSPALSGVVLAVDRRFFQKIGAYDPGMGLWGAENIELSIRVWLCGGVMEVVPCSRMGHLERSHLTHTLPDDDTAEKNKIRVAETWMDAYKQIFYKRDTVAYFIQQAESSNCSDRVKLRQTLGCRNFHWFLSNIHPELYIPQDRPGLSGELYNVGTGYCADYKRGRVGGVAMDISPCSGNGNQHCELNSQREVRWGPAGQLCFDVRGERVILSDCPQRQPSLSRQQWKMTKQSGQIVHMMTERCVEAVLGKGVASQRNGTSERGVVGGRDTPGNRGAQDNATATERGLFLRPCSSDPRQQWHFDQLVVPRPG